MTLKEQMQVSKEDLRKKKRLLREKHEREFQGDYDLIYPVVSYMEEEMIKEKII